ncbi:hypothetical protein EVAR_60627_1, partial [Eumeta japonica]
EADLSKDLDRLTQGPDSKDASSGKTSSSTTNEFGTSHEHIHETSAKSTMLQTDSLGWIYLLRKDKLIEVCKENGILINAGCTVEYLRRQLSELIRTKRQRASSENLLRSLEQEVLSEADSPVAPSEILFHVPANKVSRDQPTDMEIQATVRRWNLTYQGGDDLMEFLERLEELVECYQFNCNQLLPSMLEILKDRALQWYRVKRGDIHTWTDFKTAAIRFFLPKRYLGQLEERIHQRKQGVKEKAII